MADEGVAFGGLNMLKKIVLIVACVAGLTACEASMRAPDSGLASGNAYAEAPLSAGACDDIGALMMPAKAATGRGLGRMEASAMPVR
jgi:hypothetical protein